MHHILCLVAGADSHMLFGILPVMPGQSSQCWEMEDALVQVQRE